MEYRGYTGSVEFSREDRKLFGRVTHLGRHLVDYEGNSVDELEKDFHDAIDFYLEFCAEENIPPVTPRAAKARSGKTHSARKSREKITTTSL
jgi:predicted HicB family RNase H-like nuclease